MTAFGQVPGLRTRRSLAGFGCADAVEVAVGAEEKLLLANRRAGGYRSADFVLCDDFKCFSGANDSRQALVGDEVNQTIR